jgi:hypothetical protein
VQRGPPRGGDAAANGLMKRRSIDVPLFELVRLAIADTS